MHAAGAVKEKPAVENEQPAVQENKPFTLDQLKGAWQQFAESRKIYRAEYQLLYQPIELRESTVVLHLLNPVQETLLNSFRQDLLEQIREQLGNNTIQITGELRMEESQQIAYTNREKFSRMAEKNPSLMELKERLGLDPDF
ncbi:MAG: hypothetical protein MUE95_04225 [Cyclobacteriaceae bacterium]|nr:hypothetical protein [Cyclobacteriaceae bacterium]